MLMVRNLMVDKDVEEKIKTSNLSILNLQEWLPWRGFRVCVFFPQEK